MPNLTFSPAVGANSPMDAYVMRIGTLNETFTAKRAGAGTDNDSATFPELYAQLSAGTTSNRWNVIVRSIMLFDTSTIPSNAVITGATLSLYGFEKDNGVGSPDLNICASTPASNSTVADSDYANLGTTSFGSVSYAGFAIDSYNVITLNASGLAAISRDGITKLGARLSWDLTGTFTGTWLSGDASFFGWNSADETGTSHDPVLTVTYYLTVAPAEATHSHAADNVVLEQSNILVVQDASHSHTADIVQMTDLDIVSGGASFLGGSALGMLALGTGVYYTILDVTAIADDALHAHTAESPTIQFKITLPGVADALHGHTADNIILTFRANAQDASHALTSDVLTLVQTYLLEAQDALHGHSTDNVVVTQGYNLTVNDGTHEHTVDALVLTQSSIIVISEARHLQTADNISLLLNFPSEDLASAAFSEFKRKFNGEITESELLSESFTPVIQKEGDYVEGTTDSGSFIEG